MDQIYKYEKTKSANLGSFLVLAWIALFKIIMRNTAYNSVVFLVPLGIGSIIIWFASDLIIRKTSQVEMDDINLSRKFLSHTFWSIPILSITSIGQGMGGTGSKYSLPIPMGYIIKTNEDKFYTIPHNIINSDNFIKDLQTKNPSIVLQAPAYDKLLGLYTGTENNREYIQAKGYKNLMFGIAGSLLAFLIVGYILLTFSPKQ